MTAIHLSLLLFPVLLIAPAAFAEDVVNYELDLKAAVRILPSTNMTSSGALARFTWQPLTFSEVPGKPEWRMVKSPSGAYAFVEASALKPISVKPGYRLRSAADGAASSDKSTGQTSVIYTGKTINDAHGAAWKEAWNGLNRVFIAAAATGILAAPKPTVPAKVAVTAPDPAPAPAAPQPKPVAKPVDPDCVSTPQQYANTQRIKKAFGSANPFTRWQNSDFGIAIEPVGNRWIATIPESVRAMKPELPASMAIPMKVCVDKAGRPFVNVFNQTKYFDDANASSLSAEFSGVPLTFKRSALAQ